MKCLGYLLLAVQLVFIASVPIDEGKDVGKVKNENGKQVVLNPGTFPFIVHLDFKRYVVNKNTDTLAIERGTCGGVLIDKKIVLTAAHCIGIKKKKKPIITAWLGILDTQIEKGRGQEISVTGYTVHENYEESDPKNFRSNKNDIAILWLMYPARPDGLYIKTANLPSEDFVLENKRGWIVGWGMLSSGKQSTMLQKAVVRGVAPEKCQMYYGLTKIPKKIICIMADDKTSTSTKGDSGGPFIIRNTVVGIASFSAVNEEKSDKSKGIIAFDASIPAAYTSVPQYLKWINENKNAGPKVILLPHTPKQPTRFPPKLKPKL